MFDFDKFELETLIQAIDRSGIIEFTLVTPEGEVRVSKSSGLAEGPNGPAARAPTVQKASGQQPAPGTLAAPAGSTDPGPDGGGEAASAPDATPVAPAASTPAVPPGDGQIEVTTPMLGIFYRSPEPGAPPFVQPGDRVEPDTTVAIIEVMKVFTAVAAGVSGVVDEVLVQDRELVEHGQALLRVRPGA
jgi:acetyl-CoA carboxylase biotin carboxyl carrier protein